MVNETFWDRKYFRENKVSSLILCRGVVTQNIRSHNQSIRQDQRIFALKTKILNLHDIGLF